MEFKTIKYKKSFISKVICRIDFLDIIPTEDFFNSSVISEITKNFARKEKDELTTFKTINGIQQTYTTSDGQNKIIISNKFIIAEFSNYRTFEDFKDKIKNIISSIYSIRKITAERTGLRFINFFDSDKKIYKNMFNPLVANALTPIIAPKIDEIIPVRSMHLTEYRSDNLIINFRFGLYNKSYSKAIRTNDFVLDFDCFTNEGFQSSEDILRCIESGHDKIQYLFENSITDKLRAVMNNG